jgi:hypothetical protein
MPVTTPPWDYAASKLRALQDRRGNAFGQAVADYGARTFTVDGRPQVLWAGMSPSYLVALGVNSTGPSECTPAFEIGYYNTPALGPCGTGREASGGRWARLARDPRVVALLGREGYTGPEWAQALPDQAAIGLVDYRDGADELMRRLPSIAGREGGSWLLALAVMAYNLGPSGAAQALAPIAPQLAALPEDQRFERLTYLAVQSGNPQLAYITARAWQRLESGRQLAGTGSTFWPGLPRAQGTEARFATLAGLAERRHPLPRSSAPAPSQGPSPFLFIALGVLAYGAARYFRAR